MYQRIGLRKRTLFSGDTHRFGGEPAPPLGDREAWRQVVACVYQKLTIIPALSVAENLFLNRQAESRHPIRWAGVRREARALLDAWALDVDPRVPAGDIRLAGVSIGLKP